MIKLRNLLIAVITITSMSTAVFAGSFGFGVSGSLFAVGASGTELEAGAASDGSNNKANASENGALGSIFAEYTFDVLNGLTIGVDHIPGSANVNSQTLTRTDIQTSVEGTATTTTTSLARSAQAEIENHMTYYVELPLGSTGIYGKLGHVELDVNTKENLGTPKYGNTSVDGQLFGIGYKYNSGSKWFYKVEGTHTEFDTISLTSTGNSANSTANKIQADLDVTKATFALGFSF